MLANISTKPVRIRAFQAYSHSNILYFVEDEPKRKNFIARKLSYHGNTIGTLELSHHMARRVPYEAILDHEHFHHVSPAYAKRYQKPNETEDDYVRRLAQELDDKFKELGPDTVIACKFLLRFIPQTSPIMNALHQVVAETVVGATAGVVPPPKGYLKAMKRVCERHGALFILDEVMSGMGRMGTMHGWETYGDGATPDIQAVAKGLGGG